MELVKKTCALDPKLPPGYLAELQFYHLKGIGEKNCVLDPKQPAGYLSEF